MYEGMKMRVTFLIQTRTPTVLSLALSYSFPSGPFLYKVNPDYSALKEWTGNSFSFLKISFPFIYVGGEVGTMYTLNVAPAEVRKKLF